MNEMLDQQLGRGAAGVPAAQGVPQDAGADALPAGEEGAGGGRKSSGGSSKPSVGLRTPWPQDRYVCHHSAHNQLMLRNYYDYIKN